MGWVETRAGRNGKPRYIAKYRDARGRKQSAGTFTRKREADTAWQTAEVKITGVREQGCQQRSLLAPRDI